MALKKKDPFKDLLFLQERMSRIFDETLLKFKTSGGNHWYPPVDIYETEDFLVLKAELPGVDAGSVSVEVSDNTLSVKGERKFEKDLKEENYFRMERFYGSFQRAFSLPYAVDGKDIKANFQDGILKITVPKPKDIGPGSISIKVQ